MTRPEVSVLTPSYGYGRYIRDSIESVRQGQGVSVEHLVQDACSTDETLSVLRSYDADLQWVSEPDEGQSDALNRLAAKAEGRWIAWLNADEFYLPDGLGVLAKEGERHHADVVYADTVFVDSQGRLMRLLPAHKHRGATLRLYGPYIETCSMLIRRGVLGDAPLDTDLKRVMDWDLLLRLQGEGAKFHYVPYPIGAFRVHDARITARPPSDFRSDYDTLHTRYRIATTKRRARGKVLHVGQKMLSGAYARQRSARHLRGADLRWFIPEVGTRDFKRLLESSYGASGAPSGEMTTAG